jgi:hypothetical protein
MWFMKRCSLTICLEDDLEQELEAACAETGRSRGEISCGTLCACACSCS